MQAIGGPRQVLGEVDLSFVAEARNGPAGRGVQRDQPPAAVHEDAPLAISVPDRYAAMDVAGAVGHLSPVVGPRIERPKLLSALGLQRDDAVVPRAQVHHVVENDRRDLEGGGAHLVAGDGQSRSGERFFPGAPRPGRLEQADVLAVDLGEGGIFHPAGIPAVHRPVATGRAGLAARLRRRGDRRDEQHD